MQLAENKDKLPGKDTLVGEIGQRAGSFSRTASRQNPALRAMRELRRYIDEMLGDEPPAVQVLPAPAPLAEARGWSTLLRRT